jgi:hypothetical protein
VYWQCKCIVASETWPRGWLHTPLEKCYRGSLSDQTWLFNLKDKPYNDVSLDLINRNFGANSAD